MCRLRERAKPARISQYFPSVLSAEMCMLWDVCHAWFNPSQKWCCYTSTTARCYIKVSWRQRQSSPTIREPHQQQHCFICDKNCVILFSASCCAPGKPFPPFYMRSHCQNVLGVFVYAKNCPNYLNTRSQLNSFEERLSVLLDQNIKLPLLGSDPMEWVNTSLMFSGGFLASNNII